MAEIINYKGLQITSPAPTGAGGALIHDNTIAIADRLATVPVPHLLHDKITRRIYCLNKPEGATIYLFKKTRKRKSPHVEKLSNCHWAVVAGDVDDSWDYQQPYTLPINGYTLSRRDNDRLVLGLNTKLLYAVQWTDVGPLIQPGYYTGVYIQSDIAGPIYFLDNRDSTLTTVPMVRSPRLGPRMRLWRSYSGTDYIDLDAIMAARHWNNEEKTMKTLKGKLGISYSADGMSMRYATVHVQWVYSRGVIYETNYIVGII